MLDALNQDAADYVDPKLTADTPVEVAIISSKTIRLKTDRGQEMPAIVDSQELLSWIFTPNRSASRFCDDIVAFRVHPGRSNDLVGLNRA